MISVAPLAQKVRKVGGASENARPSDQSEAFAGFGVDERQLSLVGEWKAFIGGRGLVIGVLILTNGGGGRWRCDGVSVIFRIGNFWTSRANITIRLFSIFRIFHRTNRKFIWFPSGADFFQ